MREESEREVGRKEKDIKTKGGVPEIKWPKTKMRDSNKEIKTGRQITDREIQQMNGETEHEKHIKVFFLKRAGVKPHPVTRFCKQVGLCVYDF